MQRVKSFQQNHQLPFKLPEDYAHYLKQYGGGSLGSETLCEVKDDGNGIVETTKGLRQGCGIKDKYIVISDDGFGNPYFMKEDGSIWWAELDCGTGKVEKVSNDFLEFVWNECYDEEL